MLSDVINNKCNLLCANTELSKLSNENIIFQEFIKRPNDFRL